MDLGPNGWAPTIHQQTISELLELPLDDEGNPKRVVRIEVLGRFRGVPEFPSLWQLLCWITAAKKNGDGINGEMALYCLQHPEKSAGAVKWRNGFTGDANMTNDLFKRAQFVDELTTLRWIADYDDMVNILWWNGDPQESNDVPPLMGAYSGKFGLHCAIGGTPFNDSETWPQGIIFDSWVLHVDTER